MLLTKRNHVFQPGQQMFPQQASVFPSQPFQPQRPAQPPDPFGPIPGSQVNMSFLTGMW